MTDAGLSVEDLVGNRPVGVAVARRRMLPAPDSAERVSLQGKKGKSSEDRGEPQGSPRCVGSGWGADHCRLMRGIVERRFHGE